MRLPGTRRARGIAFLLFAVLVVVLFREARLQVARLRAGLGPAVVARAESALQREIRVDRIDVEQPGMVVLEGLRVSRGKTFADGVLLTAARVRLDYDPALLHWSSVFTRRLPGASRARLSARGVRLVQPAPLPPSEVLAADTVSTSFDIRTLLERSHAVLGTVDRVDLGRPRIPLARAADGRWSIEPLLRLSRGRRRSAFRGVIHGTGATLDFRDYRSGLLAAPARNRATGAITLNFASAPAVHFSSSALVAGADGGPLRLTGSYDDGKGEWRVFVEGGTAGLQYWYRYFARSERELKVLAGETRFSGVFWSRRARRAPVNFRLDLDVKNGAARLSPLVQDLTAFAGRVEFTPGLVSVDGSLSAAGMPVRVRGQSILAGERTSSYRLSSETVSLAGLRRLHPALAAPEKLGVTGPIRSAVTLTTENGLWLLRGTAASVAARYRDAVLGGVRTQFDASWRGGRLERATGTVRAARGRYQSHAFGDLNLRFAARDGLVNVRTTAQAWGGGVQARGWVDLGREPADFYLTGRALDVNGAELARGREKLRLEGMLSAQFVASGTTASPLVTAYVDGGPLVLNGNRLDSFSGRVRYAEETLHFPYAALVYNGQNASFSGSVAAKGDLNLTFSARGVDVRRALGQSVGTELSGTGYIQGTLSGSSETPRAEGAIQVYRPVYGKQSADYLEARFAASSPRNIQLFDVNLIRSPDRVTSRQVTLSRGAAPDAPWELAGRFEVDGLTLVRALRLAGVETAQLRETPAAGDLQAVRVDIDGPLSTPSIRFEAAVRDAQALGLDLGRVEAAGRIDAASRRVELTRLSGTLAGGALRLSGLVRQEPANAEMRPQSALLDLEYSLAGARVTPLIRRLAPQLASYAEVSSGRIEVQGRVTGSSAQPDVSASVQVADLVVNDRAIEVQPFRALWSPGAMVLEGVAARIRGGSFDVERLVLLLGAESEKLPPIERTAGVLRLREIPIDALRQLFEDSPYFQSKEASGVREALRQWRSPVAGAISGTFRVPDGRPEGERLTTARAAASALRGRSAAPLFSAVVTIPDLVSPPGPDATPTRVRADLTYGARRLAINEFTLDQEGGAHVLVRGFRDDPGSMSGGEMLLNFEAREVGLHSLARIPVADVRERLAGFQPLDGILKVDAKVSGRVSRPEIEFSLSVKAPTLMGVPFDALVVEPSSYSASKALLTLGNTRLTKRLRSPEPDGSSTGEGALTAAGRLPLAWPELRLVPGAAREFAIHLPDQPLSVFSVLAADAERLAGAEESTAAGRIRPIAHTFREIAAAGGRMRGDFHLVGPEENPADYGDLYVTDGTLRVDGFQTRILDFNAHAALKGRELRLKCSGKGALGGTLSATGKIDLRSRAANSPPADINLELVLDAFRFDEKALGALAGEGLAGSQARGTLHTVAADSPQQPAALLIRGVWPRPTVVGGVRVDDATLSLALQPAVRESAEVFPGDVQLNVRLYAGRDVWLRNAQVRLKLDGQLHATSSLNEPLVEGTLQASRGTFTLPTLRLRNAAGRIRVHYDARGRSLGLASLPPVYVDLSASTSIRLQRSPAVEAEYYDVTFQIRGSPGGGGESSLRPASVGGGVAVGPEGGLQLAVRADPPLPRGEIEALIRQQFGVEGFTGTGANVEEALRGQIEQAFAVNVASIVTTPIEQAIQSRLGLDLFSIELGVSQPLRVRLGKRLLGRLYGMVSQQWSSVEGQQRRLELYYRLSPNLRVGYRQEEPIRDRVVFFSGTASF